MKNYAAPAPLHTLPHRHSVNESQIILTPDELAAQNGMRAEPMIASLDEPLHLEPVMSNTQRGSNASIHGEGYFEGIVGLKQDGTVMVDSTPGNNSPYSKYPHSPQSAPAYRRDGNLDSPQRALSSPTAVYMQPTRSYSPSGLGQDGKPVFAIPFAPNGYAHQDGLLGPPDAKMERQGSQDGADPATWQRWHRPSFPFPPPPGVNYNNYDSSSPIEGIPTGARPSFSQ